MNQNFKKLPFLHYLFQDKFNNFENKEYIKDAKNLNFLSKKESKLYKKFYNIGDAMEEIIKIFVIGILISFPIIGIQIYDNEFFLYNISNYIALFSISGFIMCIFFHNKSLFFMKKLKKINKKRLDIINNKFKEKIGIDINSKEFENISNKIIKDKVLVSLIEKKDDNEKELILENIFKKNLNEINNKINEIENDLNDITNNNSILNLENKTKIEPIEFNIPIKEKVKINNVILEN